MRSLLKLTLLATGVAAVGLVGLYAYRQYKKHAAQQGVQASETASSKSGEPTFRKVNLGSNDETAGNSTAHGTAKFSSDHSIPTAAEHHTAHMENPPIAAADTPDTSADTDSAEAPAGEAYETMVLLTGKRIIIHGVQTTRSPEGFLYTDGVRQMVKPGMDADEAREITELQALVAKRIAQIVHNRATPPYFTQKKRIGRFVMKIYTAGELKTDTTEHVLVQIAPTDQAALPDLRVVYLFVERDGLVASTPECELDSDEWLWQTEVIYDHILYALEELPCATHEELTGMLAAMRSQFLMLGRRLKTTIATRVAVSV